MPESITVTTVQKKVQGTGVVNLARSLESTVELLLEFLDS